MGGDSVATLILVHALVSEADDHAPFPAPPHPQFTVFRAGAPGSPHVLNPCAGSTR